MAISLLRQKPACDIREAAERAACPACIGERCHTPEEWLRHPMAGHGFTFEQGWTHEWLETPRQ